MIASKKHFSQSTIKLSSLDNPMLGNPQNYSGFDAQFQKSFFVSMTLIAILTIALPIVISSLTTTGSQTLPKQSEVTKNSFWGR